MTEYQRQTCARQHRRHAGSRACGAAVDLHPREPPAGRPRRAGSPARRVDARKQELPLDRCLWMSWAQAGRDLSQLQAVVGGTAQAVCGARASASDMPAGLSPASMSGDAQCSAQKAAANAADAATYTDTTKHSTCHLRRAGAPAQVRVRESRPRWCRGRRPRLAVAEARRLGTRGAPVRSRARVAAERQRGRRAGGRAGRTNAETEERRRGGTPGHVHAHEGEVVGQRAADTVRLPALRHVLLRARAAPPLPALPHRASGPHQARATHWPQRRRSNLSNHSGCWGGTSVVVDARRLRQKRPCSGAGCSSHSKELRLCSVCLGPPATPRPPASRPAPGGADIPGTAAACAACPRRQKLRHAPRTASGTRGLPLSIRACSRPLHWSG